MNVSEISFCGRVGFNIKSEDAKRNILQKLENTYGLKIVAKHYEKFTSENAERSMRNINNNLHMICTRTNGNPYFLYLVKINFTNYCIFIDKKIQQGYYYPRMIISHIFFEDSLFDKDIVFDGEMIKLNDGKWTYMINDLLVHNNKYLTDTNLVKRMNICYEMLGQCYQNTDTDIFKIMVKKYFTYDQLNHLIDDFIPSRKYSCRGIYFKPLYLKFKDILVNFDDSLVCKVERVKYKNVKNFLLLGDDVTKQVVEEVLIPKPLEINKEKIELQTSGSTTFMVKKTSNPDVYELYTSSNEYVDIAYIPKLSVSKKMRELFRDVNLVTKLQIECEYYDKFKKWFPLV